MDLKVDESHFYKGQVPASNDAVRPCDVKGGRRTNLKKGEGQV